MPTLPPQTVCTRLTCASSKQRMADKDRLEFELSTLLSSPAGDITSTQQAAQRALSLSLPHSLTGECLPTVPQPQWESAGMTVYRTRGARQLPVPSSPIYPLLSRRNYTAHYTLCTAHCTLYSIYGTPPAVAAYSPRPGGPQGGGPAFSGSAAW